MNDFTEDLGNGIKKALGVDKANSALDTIGNAATKVKNAFMGTSSSAPSGGGADAGMVSEANKTFADKAAKTAAPKLKAPTGAAPGKKPSFKDGTDYVPKTGDAKLHKGEAVLKKEDADKYREAKMKSGTMSSVAEELSGKADKPKKEIKHMHIKKAANGGHIIRHEHTHPEHHPDEEHTTKTDDDLASHVLQNMGTPNPGEAEADAGQSGIPGAAAAQGAPAGASTPAAVPGM